MVNATEMARPFDKRPTDWMRLPSTLGFLSALREVRFPHLTQGESSGLIITERGNFSDGREQGTWMHEDVALEFARWLSPEFAIWCNDRIKELLRVGMTAMPQTVEAMLADPDLVIGLATQLKAERQRVETLTQDVAMLGAKTLDQEKELEAAAPKVLFADSLAASESSVLVRELAIILKQNGIEIGQNRLFEWLRDNNYLCSRGESHNLPTQRAMELKLFEIKKSTVTQPDGTVFVTSTTKVTTKGQQYFVNQFLYGRA